MNSFLLAFLPQCCSAQPRMNILKPSAKPVSSPSNCLPGVFHHRGTEEQCLALSESLKSFYEDWLIFIVNLTRFRVTRRPNSSCVCEGLTWEGGTYPECDWHSPVSWIPRWNLEKEKERWTLAALSLSFQTMKVMLTYLTLKPRARTNSYFLKLHVYQCFFPTATRIINTNCWFTELSVLAGPHRVTATGRG